MRSWSTKSRSNSINIIDNVYKLFLVVKGAGGGGGGGGGSEVDLTFFIVFN